MGKITLKRFDLDEESFEKIRYIFGGFFRTVSKNEFESCYKGYADKDIIKHCEYIDGEYFIITEKRLQYALGLERTARNWRQVICRKCQGQKNNIEESIDGSRAYAAMMKLLRTVYTKNEIDECLRSHEAEYNKDLIQVHYTSPSFGRIKRFKNCRKYDINGAHQAALIKIFPKAKEIITTLYLERKVKPINKKYINYFVGMLKRKGYEKTYNWIVQTVSKTLLSAIEATKGLLVYANTDGFIVTKYENIIPTSTNLGEFKLEYEGDVWVYQDKNYWCYQTSTGEITGSIRQSVRDQVRLMDNVVVHYDIKKEFYEHTSTEEVLNIEREILR